MVLEWLFHVVCFVERWYLFLGVDYRMELTGGIECNCRYNTSEMKQ